MMNWSRQRQASAPVGRVGEASGLAAVCAFTGMHSDSSVGTCTTISITIYIIVRAFTDPRRRARARAHGAGGRAHVHCDEGGGHANDATNALEAKGSAGGIRRIRQPAKTRDPT